MPTIELTSPKTGKTFQVQVEGNPTDADIEHMVADHDATAQVRTPEESMAQALKRSSKAGVFPEEGKPGEASQGASSFAEGALDQLLAGTPQAGAKLSGVDLNAPSSPKFTDPYAYSRGEIMSSILPIGTLLRWGMAGKTALQQIGRGALAGGVGGGIYGGAGGASKKIQEKGFEATPQEVIEAGKEGAIPGAILGTVAGGALSPLAAKAAQNARGRASSSDLGSSLNPFQKAAQTPTKYNPKAMPEQQRLLEAVTAFPESNVQANSRVQGGQYLPVIDSLRPFFKKDSGASGFLQATKARNADIAGQVDPVIEGFAKELMPSSGELTDAATKRLVDEGIAAKEAEVLLKSFEDDLKDLSPTNIKAKASNYNDRLARAYDKSEPITSNQLKATQAVRDVISETVHSMLDTEDPSGKLSDLYRESGMVGELASQLQSNLRGAVKERMGASVQPILARGVKSVINPIGGMAFKGKKLAGIAQQKSGGGDLKLLNDQVNRLFLLGPSNRVQPTRPATPSGLPVLKRSVATENMANQLKEWLQENGGAENIIPEY